MNKKRVALIGLIAFLIIGIIMLFVFISRQQNEKTASQTTSPTPSPAEISPSTQTKQYQDAAGFEFSYPDDITVETQENESKTVYSDLKLISSEVSGNTTILVEETKSKTIQDFFKKNNIATDEATIASDSVKLAEKDATNVSKENTIETYLIDEGIIFEIKTTWDDEADATYWKTIHEKIISTFAFVAPEETTTESSGGNAAPAPADESAIEFEGEETIE